MQKLTPFYTNIVTQEAQVLIDLTIPLNLFFPFLDSIRIGIDPVAGLGSVYVLSEDLRWYLGDLGITSLNHTCNLVECTSNQAYWLSAEDLNLGGIWKEHWNIYVKGLSQGCIKFSENNDTLLWI